MGILNIPVYTKKEKKIYIYIYIYISGTQMGPLVFGLKKALFGRIDLPKIEVIGAPGMYIYIYIYIYIMCF